MKLNDPNKLNLVDRVDFLLAQARGRAVLHLGCTNYPYTEASISDGTLLHARLAEVAKELTGFDADERGIAALSPKGFGPLVLADLEKLEDVALEKRFEVVIAGEMIEHLSNPGLFLRGIKRFLAEDGRLVVTTINSYSAMRFAQYAVRGRGGVAEPVHPDHVAYYSYRTLRLVVEREGFNLDEFAFYDLGAEHRPHVRPALRFINDISVKLSAHLADGVIGVFKLGE